MIEDDGATAEVEEVKEPQLSVEDTLRSTYDEIIKRGADPQEPAEDAPAGAARTPDGKFAPKAEPEDGEGDPVVDVGEPTEPAVDVPAIAAPNTWRKDVAAKWATLPEDVRAEVQRRESDFHKGIAQYKEKAEFGSAIERAVAPYAATLQTLGIAPDRAVQELMAADHRLRYGSPHDKHQYFAQLAQNYGIDLSQVSQATQNPIDPNYAALQDELRRVRGMVESQTIAEQKREQDALNSDILRFKSDPAHSHFETVKGHMAALLQAGQANGLADAYEQAVYANPATRQTLIQAINESYRKAMAEKAESAKKVARLNIRSRPSVPTSTPIGTINETLASVYDRLTA